MDPIKFKTQLKLLAEVRDVKPFRYATEHISDDTVKVVIEGESIELSQEFNPTLGVELVKVKEINRICEMGCGKIVANQKIEKRFTDTPLPHWKTRCTNCGAYINPEGTGLITDSQLAHAAFRNFYMRKK